MDAHASRNARGRSLRFLANVDPVGVARALEGLNPETTLAIVISKTFTTAETMLNARTVKDWIVSSLGASATPKHMIAVSTNVSEVTKFGIDPNNIFEFWDWVGGRYSVCSAVGLVPLAIQFGYDVVDSFLAGARSVDQNFLTAQPRNNLPLILGLLGMHTPFTVRTIFTRSPLYVCWY
jgi:glucose-6-phosphate isomerase